MRRLIAFVAVAFVAALAAGCGIPSDSSARQIADDKVPFELLGPSTTVPGTTIAGGTTVHVYFIDGTQLRAINRSVPASDARTVLDELVKGVTDQDPSGVTTAIPKDTQIVSVALDGTTLVVTLNSAILDISGAEQKNAFGQLVYTVADLDFSGVRFRVTDPNGGNEQDVQTPTDNGTKAGPVTTLDFFTIKPR